MKVKSNAIDELISPLRQYFQKDSFNREDVNEKPPLRSELFTILLQIRKKRKMMNWNKRKR